MRLYWCLLIVLYINKNAGDPTEKEKLYHNQVGLLANDNFIFGGVIISDKWVMTFSYYVRDTKWMVFGTNKYTNWRDDVNRVQISKAFINGRLALLKINDTKFEEYAKVSPLELPDKDRPLRNKTGSLIGWHHYVSPSLNDTNDFRVVKIQINVGTFYREIGEYEQVGTEEKREPSNCYFCLLVPTPSKKYEPSSGESSKPDSEEDIGHPNYGFTDAVEEGKPYFPNQKDVNDLSFTKSNAVLLISRLIH